MINTYHFEPQSLIKKFTTNSFYSATVTQVFMQWFAYCTFFKLSTQSYMIEEFSSSPLCWHGGRNLRQILQM